MQPLLSALVRIDRQQIKQQISSFSAFTEWQEKHNKEKEEEGEGEEEEEKKQLAAIKKELKSANQPTTKADLNYQLQLQRLLSVKPGASLLAESSILRGGSLQIYQAAAATVGCNREVLGDWEYNQQWNKLRKTFRPPVEEPTPSTSETDNFWTLLQSFNPRLPPTTATSLQSQISSWLSSSAENKSELSSRNFISFRLFEWVNAVLEVTAQLVTEEKQEKLKIKRLQRQEAEKAAKEQQEREEQELKQKEEQEEKEGAEEDEEDTN